MRELLKLMFDSFSSLKAQLQAALSIPLTGATHADESEAAAHDSMEARGDSGSSCKSFKCVDDRPGYMTSNGLGSLEIGAAHDD
jgi:hypothetical protein